MTQWGDVVAGFSRVFQLLTDDVEAAIGVPVRQWEVLLRLDQSESGTLSTGELGTLLSYPPSRITRLIDAMVAGNLVERSVSPHDRRVVLVTATTAGRELLARGLEVHRRGLEEYVVAAVGTTGLHRLARDARSLMDANGRPPEANR